MKRLISAILCFSIIFSSISSVSALDIYSVENVDVVTITEPADNNDFSEFRDALLRLITDYDDKSDNNIGDICDSADKYYSNGDSINEAPELLIVKSYEKIDTLDAIDYVGGYDGLYFLQFDNYDSLYDAYDYYQSLDFVEFVQIDGKFNESVIDEDVEVFTEATLYSSTQYMSDFYGYTDARANMGSNEVVIAVVDSGVQYDHERLIGRVEPTGFDAVENKSCYDTRGHGTHVAGIIVANTNSNVTIRPYKVIDNNGDSTDTALYLGIMAAIEDDVDIINLSLTKKGKSDIIHEAVIAAYEANITVVAAAGNSGENLADNYYSPASFPEVICTVAVDSTKYKASYSNWGSTKDLSAPGTDILSTHLNNTYKVMSGTSMACPFMTSCVSYLLADDDTLTPDQVYEALLANTKRGGGTHNIKYVTPGTLVQSNTTCAVPVFNYTPGTFSGYINVSLSCSTPNAEIVYRTSDMADKTYKSYTGPIKITDTTSFTAYAIAKGYKDSSTSTAKYTLSDQSADLFVVDETGKLLSYSGTTSKLTIPDYHNDLIINRISDGAFINNTRLSSLTCGSFLTVIESGSFDGCTSFETLNASAITSLEDGLFEDSPIKSITAKAVTEIPSEYFMYNNTISTLNISSVTLIGDRAFYGTTSISSISASSLKTIGTEAFAYSSISNLDAKKISTIGEYAFKNSNLKSASFTSISSLGAGAFKNCSLLISASIGGTTVIPAYTFQNCSKLQSFSLSRVTSVGYKAFNNCTSLTKCNFPSASNIVFDESVFENCLSLAFVQISCKFDISPKMFKGCKSLTDIRTGTNTSSNIATIDDIGEEGLYGCRSLTIENFPISGANSLGKNALVNTGISDVIHKELYLDLNQVHEGGFNGIRCERLYFLDLDILYDIPDNCKVVGLDYYLEDVDLSNDLDTEAVFYGDDTNIMINYCANNDLHYEIYIKTTNSMRILRDVEPVCYGEGYTISFEAIAWKSSYTWYGCNNEDKSDKVELTSLYTSTVNLYDYIAEHPEHEFTYYYCVVKSAAEPYRHEALNKYTSSSLCRYDPTPENSIAVSVTGTDDTIVDFGLNLVITDSLDNINTINNIFSDISSNVVITPSHNNIKAKGYGTGTTITIYDLHKTNIIKTMTLIVKGDTNGDGVIDALDAAVVARYQGNRSISENDYIGYASDLDGSGHIDVFDYQAIVNKVVA